MELFQNVIGVIGCGLLFAFLAMLLHSANSNPADIKGQAIVTVIAFMVGVGFAIHSLST